MQVQQQLARRFPGVEVIPSNYPPAAHKVMIAQLVQGLQLAFIGATWFADSIFPALGMAVPDFFHSIQENKLGASVGAWFMGNTVAQNMLATSAFEVYYSGEKIFSKLESGKMPRLNFLVDEIASIRRDRG